MTTTSPPVTHRRKAWIRNLLGWLAILILVPALIEVWLYHNRLDTLLPPLAAHTLDGQPIRWGVGEQHPAILYLWADWCPVCKAQQPLIHGLAADYPMLSIALKSDDPHHLNTAMRQHGVHIPTLDDADGRITASLGVHAVPVLILLQPDGRIGWISRGLTPPWSVRLRLWWMGW